MEAIVPTPKLIEKSTAEGEPTPFLSAARIFVGVKPSQARPTAEQAEALEELIRLVCDILEAEDGRSAVHAKEGAGNEEECIELSFHIAAESASFQTFKVQVSQSGAYTLSKRGRVAEVSAAGVVGLFYGFCTFRQMLRGGAFEGEIHDWPTFEERGVLLDISRDRVPTLAYAKVLIRKLSLLKLNHFQLYTEHTFAYKKHETVWRDSSPFTAEEVMELDRWCAKHYVKLVPNQNTLGHMNRWLKHHEYNHLAEVPEGVSHPFSLEKEPFTLCPTNPEALDLVKNLLTELTVNFKFNLSQSPPLLNVNLDEPFDLGRQNSRKECKRTSKDHVYAQYGMKVYEFAQTGLQPAHRVMLWADRVGKNTLKELAQDIILLEWNYDKGHKWAKRCELLTSTGNQMMVVVGTCAFCSIGGRTRNAIAHCREAAVAGDNCEKCIGYLITDWGDYGHHNPPTSSVIGYVVGAQNAWTGGDTAEVGLDETELERKCCAFVESCGMLKHNLARAAYRIGLANDLALPAAPNFSILWLALSIPEPLHNNHLIDFAFETFLGISAPKCGCLGWLVSFAWKTKITRKKLDATMVHLERVIAEDLDSDKADDSRQKKELLFAARLLRLTCLIWKARARIGLNKPSAAIMPEDHTTLQAELSSLVVLHKTLWLETSRPGGLQDSVSKLELSINYS